MKATKIEIGHTLLQTKKRLKGKIEYFKTKLEENKITTIKFFYGNDSDSFATMKGIEDSYLSGSNSKFIKEVAKYYLALLEKELAKVNIDLETL